MQTFVFFGIKINYFSLKMCIKTDVLFSKLSKVVILNGLSLLVFDAKCLKTSAMKRQTYFIRAVRVLLHPSNIKNDIIWNSFWVRFKKKLSLNQTNIAETRKNHSFNGLHINERVFIICANLSLEQTHNKNWRKKLINK